MYPPPPAHTLTLAHLEQQRSTILEKLEAQHTPLERVAWSARSGFVPLEIVAAYLVREASRRGYTTTPKGMLSILRHTPERRDLDVPEGLSKYEAPILNLLNRWLSLKGRRFDEAEQYHDLEEGFTRFVLSDPQAKSEVEAAYAKKNRFLRPTVRAEPIEAMIQGWNSAVVLRDLQREEITRLLDLGEGISAADVGCGKTLIGIGLALSALERGLCRRPLLICPMSVIGKWRRELLLAKPDAKVRVIGADPQFADEDCVEPLLDEDGEVIWCDSTGAEALTAQLHALTAGDFDLALISITSLGRIPMHPQNLLELIEQEYEAHLSQAPFRKARSMSAPLYEQYIALKAQALLDLGEITLDTLAEATGKLEAVQADIDQIKANKRLSEREQELLESREAQKDRFIFFSKAARLLAQKSAVPLGVTWEALGIDCLIVDELHNFKALLPVTDYGDVKYLGADDATSERALDLYYKTRELQRRTHGWGFFGLTATPLVNSPLDVYCLFKYFSDNPFERVDLYSTGQFLNRFGDIREELSYDTRGEVRTQRVFKGFINLGELRSLAFQKLRRITAREAGLTVPQETLEYMLYAPDPVQEEVLFGILDDPVNAMRRYGGKLDIPEDLEPGSELHKELLNKYFLASLHLLQRAELDLEMLDFEAYPDHLSPKVKGCLEDIALRLSRGERVVLFCDLKDMPAAGKGKKKNPRGRSFHEKLRLLIHEHCGVPKERIALINADATPRGEDRLKICDDLKYGRLSVVIGNMTMGEGVDLQWGVSTLLNLDIPYNVARLEQRIGRIKRPGNPFEKVSIRFHMGTLGLDPHMLDTVWGKRGWYDTFWSGDCDSLETPLQEAMPSRAKIEALRLRDPEARAAALEALKAQERAASQRASRILAAGIVKKLQVAALGLAALPGRLERGYLTPVKAEQEQERLEAELHSFTEALERHPGFAAHREALRFPLRFCFEPKGDTVLREGQEGLFTPLYGTAKLVRVMEVNLTARSALLQPLMLSGEPNGSTLETRFFDLPGATFAPHDPNAYFADQVAEHGPLGNLRRAVTRTSDPDRAAALQDAFSTGLLRHLQSSNQPEKLILENREVRLVPLGHPGELLSPVRDAHRDALLEQIKRDPERLIAATGEHSITDALRAVSRVDLLGAWFAQLKTQGFSLRCYGQTLDALSVEP